MKQASSLVELVRDGKASPEQAALLLELRQKIAARKHALPHFLAVFVFLAAVSLAFFTRPK